MIFLDTTVVSEISRKSPDPRVIAWLVRYDAELALSTVTIAEIAFGIARIGPDQRAARLGHGLADWRRRFADRIFGLTEEAALAHGTIMGSAFRQGAGMSAPDGMIAAIAKVNGGRLATRNLTDFRTTGLDLRGTSAPRRRTRQRSSNLAGAVNSLSAPPKLACCSAPGQVRQARAGRRQPEVQLRLPRLAHRGSVQGRRLSRRVLCCCTP